MTRRLAWSRLMTNTVSKVRVSKLFCRFQRHDLDDTIMSLDNMTMYADKMTNRPLGPCRYNGFGKVRLFDWLITVLRNRGHCNNLSEQREEKMASKTTMTNTAWSTWLIIDEKPGGLIWKQDDISPINGLQHDDRRFHHDSTTKEWHKTADHTSIYQRHPCLILSCCIVCVFVLLP